MTQAVSVFTCSHNKPGYVTDAVESVLAQDRGDFEYWILENSTDGGETRRVLRPYLADLRIRYEEITLGPEDRLPARWPGSVLLNRYYGKAAGEFVLFLADDDVLMKNCLSRCLAEFAAHPDWHAVWFTLWREMWDAQQGRFRPAGSIPAVNDVGKGCAQEKADCRVDGGQVMHRRACLDELGPPPWFPEEQITAHHGDGVFLQKLADLHPLRPVPDHLVTHRATPVSSWDKPQGRLTVNRALQ